MKKWISTILSISLVIGMAAVLHACGKPKPETDTTTESATWSAEPDGETGKSALRPGFLTSAAVLPNPEPELLLAYGSAPSKKPEPAPVQAAPRAKKSDSTGKKDAGEKK